MNSRQFILTVFLIAGATSAIAQTDADALRYSQSSISGTARFTSMGGAFGALGGDFSSIGINPAGLGIYRKSEFTISSSIYMNQVTSDFIGWKSSENKFNFNIPNLGFVFTHRTQSDKKDKEGWKTVSVGFGLNRINNFHSRSFYESENSHSSLLNHFVETANNSSSLDPFYEQLAYDAGIIYTDGDTTATNYISDVGAPGTYPITQRRSSTTRGGITEWNISVGANYNNKLYLGGAIGITSIRYIEESLYMESDPKDLIPVLNNYSLQQDLETKGSGINLRIGLIARPVEWVRIGASFQTPTLYPTMRDEYSNTITSSLDSISTTPASSPDGVYEYAMITPLKATGSLAFIIGKSGLISADYEFVDYSGARFDAADASFSPVNDLIREKYNSAGNLRIGGEYKLDALSFRAGYGMYGSPVSASRKISGADYSKTYYTGGIGIRDKNYFIDLGYAYGLSKEYFQQYSIENVAVEGSRNEVVNHNFVLTFGVKF